jgi:endogenous inhibitor of DNA gyrase (YacG/DUF329 family)
MTEKVQANLSIELNVTCPHCDEYFNLFEIDNGRLNDDGYLMKSACPDGYWIDEHGKFKETVTCPDCEKPVEIEGIAW